jgi:hypothetical protein
MWFASRDSLQHRERGDLFFERKKIVSKQIPLTQGKFATADDEDYDDVNKYKWFAQHIGEQWYASSAPKHNAHILLHRYLMKVTEFKIKVDHIDGNGLNCQRSNMRLCTQSQNMRNRGANKNNKSGFKGVSFDKRSSKWVAGIKLNRKRISIGFYAAPEEAARAYDEKAKELFGEFAHLNFP